MKAEHHDPLLPEEGCPPKRAGWWEMNLGQAKLRILQLEDELAAAVRRATPQVTVYPGPRRGIGKLIRSVMPREAPGLRPAKIAALLDDVDGSTVSAYVSRWADVRKTGEPRHHRYYLDPEPAA